MFCSSRPHSVCVLSSFSPNIYCCSRFSLFAYVTLWLLLFKQFLFECEMQMFHAGVAAVCLAWLLLCEFLIWILSRAGTSSWNTYFCRLLCNACYLPTVHLYSRVRQRNRRILVNLNCILHTFNLIAFLFLFVSVRHPRCSPFICEARCAYYYYYYLRKYASVNTHRIESNKKINLPFSTRRFRKQTHTREHLNCMCCVYAINFYCFDLKPCAFYFN